MFSYHLRLAWKSLWGNRALSLLMVAAIAVGIGVCMTTLTIYYLMSSNPIAHRNDVLFAVQLDGWDPEEGYNQEPDGVPWELTWRDAIALRKSDIPKRQAAMYKATFVVQPEREDVNPFLSIARVTDSDFFGLFDVPFLYGNAWDKAADEAGEQVVVLSRSINERVFGGENSVGRTVRMGDRSFRVAGVLKDWNPTPKFFDPNNGAYDDAEDIYVPFTLTRALELDSAGNTNCWKPEPRNSYDDFMNSECVWIQYWVELSSAQQQREYQRHIDAYAKTQKALGRFERPLDNRLTKVSDWLDVRRVVADDSKVLVGLAFMFLAVCLFNTVGLLLSKFVGKASQISIRRALGATRGELFRQHLVEVSVIGLLGGAFGLGLSYLGLWGVRALNAGAERTTYLDLNMVLLGVVLALISAVAAGLYPTWRAANVDPAPFLRAQ
ncbi:MAG: ABC transporter permease [Pseudomonadota bacterium]